MEEAQQRERRLLDDPLQGGGHVGMAVLELGLGQPAWAEDGLERRRDPARPAGHVVIEVAQIDHQLPVVLRPADEVAHRPVEALGVPVGREAHDLPLTAPGPEAEVVGHRRVDEAEGVRQADRMQPINPGSTPPAEPRRDVLPGAVEREERRLVEGRHVEAARRVRQVMLDVAELEAGRASRGQRVVAQVEPETEDLEGVARPVGRELHERARQVAERPGRPAGDQLPGFQE